MEEWELIDEVAHLIRLLEAEGVKDGFLLDHIDKILLSGLAERRKRFHRQQFEVFRPLDRVQVRDGVECRWDGKRWCPVG